MTELSLVAVGDVEPELLAWLAETLAGRFGVSVGPGEPLEPPDEWRSDGTGCLNSNRVVDALIARDAGSLEGAEVPGRWVLAVTEEDLFAPGRSFVFGEAAQDGAWAVIGLARLRIDLRSSRPADLLRRRVLTEAVHELGHLWGLDHCERPECVMFPSETLEDTDRKRDVWCPACEAARRAAAESPDRHA